MAPVTYWTCARVPLGAVVTKGFEGDDHLARRVGIAMHGHNKVKTVNDGMRLLQTA